MKIIGFLWRCSRRTVTLAILAGIVSGAGNSGLLALMHAGLYGAGAAQTRFLWGFIALSVVVPVSRIASEVMLVRLGQQTMYDLRMQLARRILAVPLRHLEQLGAPRVQAVLTGDIPIIASAATLVPVLCINLTTIVTCLVYLGLLSWKMLLATSVFIVLGVVHLPASRQSGERFFPAGAGRARRPLPALSRPDRGQQGAQAPLSPPGGLHRRPPG